MRSHSMPSGRAGALAVALTTLIACMVSPAVPVAAAGDAPATPASAQLASELPEVIAAGHDSGTEVLAAAVASLPQQRPYALVESPVDGSGPAPSGPLYRLAPKTSPPRKRG